MILLASSSVCFASNELKTLKKEHIVDYKVADEYYDSINKKYFLDFGSKYDGIEIEYHYDEENLSCNVVVRIPLRMWKAASPILPATPGSAFCAAVLPAQRWLHSMHGLACLCMPTRPLWVLP